MYEVNDLQDMMRFVMFGLDRELPPWVKMDGNLPLIHLGPGIKHVPGMVELEWPDYDFECIGPYQLGFPDCSVGGAVATHVLEHLYDPRPIMREVARVLAPGCPFNIMVPHADSLLAKEDLDHKTFFTIDTWKTSISSRYYAKYRAGLEKFRVGTNFMFALKEQNTVLVTQLVKQ